MDRGSFFLMAFLLLPSAALAQASLEGSWNTEITPPGASPFTFTAQIEQVSDSLSMTTTTEHGVLVMEDVSYAQERLHFVMPTGHGSVTCDVFRKEENAFAGVCTGSMGESVTTMKRSEQD